VKDDHALQRNYTEGVVKCAELKKKKQNQQQNEAHLFHVRGSPFKPAASAKGALGKCLNARTR